ncbi:hypothetical protein N2597_04360 [Rhizobium sophoriradicis]|uniref:hypothetical protein n=1 Tax=Rhizobium sophoriradicis TaxID=1535245 RepID=UPI001833D8E3|nr:hypothetical protein N2597_04360 [Rhizobium leguminosarum bv. phaseoli]
MKPERKIITHLRINEVSAVDHPAQTGAVVTIMKSADGDRTKPITRLKNIELAEVSLVERGANQFANVAIWKSAAPVIAPPATYTPTPEGEALLTKMLAAIRGEAITKSHNEEPHNMSNETRYDRLVKSYSDRHGVSIAKAAQKLMEDDREAVAEAYEKDEAEAVARRFAEASRQ